MHKRSFNGYCKNTRDAYAHISYNLRKVGVGFSKSGHSMG